VLFAPRCIELCRSSQQSASLTLRKHYTEQKLQIPEERSFVKCNKYGIVVEVSKVDLAATDNDRNAGAEMLSFWEPVSVDAA